MKNGGQENQAIARFIHEERKRLGMTQVEMADRAGVGLRFVRELEQGKETVRLDKVNQVLSLFGYELAPARTVMSRRA